LPSTIPSQVPLSKSFAGKPALTEDTVSLQNPRTTVAPPPATSDRVGGLTAPQYLRNYIQMLDSREYREIMKNWGDQNTLSSMGKLAVLLQQFQLKPWGDAAGSQGEAENIRRWMEFNGPFRREPERNFFNRADDFRAGRHAAAETLLNLKHNSVTTDPLEIAREIDAKQRGFDAQFALGSDFPFAWDPINEKWISVVNQPSPSGTSIKMDETSEALPPRFQGNAAAIMTMPPIVNHPGLSRSSASAEEENRKPDNNDERTRVQTSMSTPTPAFGKAFDEMDHLRRRRREEAEEKAKKKEEEETEQKKAVLSTPLPVWVQPVRNVPAANNFFVPQPIEKASLAPMPPMAPMAPIVPVAKNAFACDPPNTIAPLYTRPANHQN
jgi:hypothetical protein